MTPGLVIDAQLVILCENYNGIELEIHVALTH